MFNIAFATFRELTRNKVLYIILLFGLALIFFSLFLSSLSLGETNKIVLDFGLAMIEIFGFITVIFVGSQLLFREIDGKNIYLILSKPIARYEFILGKFLGFSSILFVAILFQSIIFFITLFLSKTPLTIWIIFSIIFIYLKLIILFALILFLSTFMSSILLIIISILIYFTAHSVSAIIDLAIKSNNTFFIYLSKFLGVIFPNFESLNIKNLVGTIQNIDPKFIVINLIYALVYLIVILIFTIFIFNKKEFEN
ncbi:MAG: ABC transporter permease subunit [Candidatus Gracilibacteria bacterium]|nr:ABC transporter permease subunit [Candidatus Gracilibacteria bacterium]MDD4530727.1 ABC transporter permease subunit [Candidatus Gracilibacteria bacterium]